MRCPTALLTRNPESHGYVTGFHNIASSSGRPHCEVITAPFPSCSGRTMHIPVRSCLIAGMLALPVGTIMATPMTSLRTRPDTAHSPVHIQQIQLAVSAPPVTTRHVAHTAMPVHALAEVTRKFESAK